MDRHRDRAQEERPSEPKPIQDPSEDLHSSERRIDDTETLVTCGDISEIRSSDISEIRSMEDLGFMPTWTVAICTLCKFVVDKALLVDHLGLKHGLDNPNDGAILQVARQYAPRPHLAIIWNEATENQVDKSMGPSNYNAT
ncbi:hypothetical protein V1508DRAFT_427611 [Lipomyces doorenjongii]|uniref:uncharacterized protein n=1 Tax=Lipomyces doorenjongii TaxID=383834 RepID=UPI0034CE8C66